VQGQRVSCGHERMVRDLNPGEFVVPSCYGSELYYTNALILLVKHICVLVFHCKITKEKRISADQAGWRLRIEETSRGAGFRVEGLKCRAQD